MYSIPKSQSLMSLVQRLFKYFSYLKEITTLKIGNPKLCVKNQ